MHATKFCFLIPLFSFLFLANWVAAAELSDNLKRNKSLETLLTKNPFERDRVVKFLKRDDENTALLISLPNQNTLRPFPTLYVLLDGDRRLLSGLEFAHTRGDTNVVFVGLPSSNRIRDLTSELLPNAKQQLDPFTQSLLNNGPLKGADYSRFLANKVVPFLEQEYGPFAIKILVGGSLGGISVLDTMLSYPESFDAYAALSPSLWYNFEYYQEKFVALSKMPTRLSNKCLLMTASEDEIQIFEGARKLDKIIHALELPQAFRYQYKRLEELTHNQAIQLGYLLVPPFVFNGSFILTPDALKELSLEEFQQKIALAAKTKSCFRHPTIEQFLGPYENYGRSLVEENRYDDAFSLYQIIKTEVPHRTLSLLAKDSFIFSAFDRLSKAQRDNLAKDYIVYYSEGMKNNPNWLVHSTNFDMVKYIEKEKLGVPPHQLLRIAR